MSCYAPISAWRSAKLGKDGKRAIQFTPRGAFTDMPLSLPCGKCIGCKLERSRVWAVRCLHERKMHKQSCFVTLTYDNEHLPHDGSLSLRDLQLFMKRVRAFFYRRDGVLIKHYGCGEYGDLNKRPHYHVLLFGCDFPDKRKYSESSRGDVIYSSALLDSLWGLGSTKVGAVSFETAAYVARYCMKKVDGAKREAGHYLVYDMDGVVTERQPEFAIMSKRGGGIGMSYYKKFGAEIRTHDNIIVNGKPTPSIRYYDKLFEALDPFELARVKQKRSHVGSYADFLHRHNENTGARRLTKEQLAELTIKQKKRNL